MSESGPGWFAHRVRPSGYLITTVLVALTGLILAAAHEAGRRAHSAKRIRVEHGISHLKNWRAVLGRLRVAANMYSSSTTMRKRSWLTAEHSPPPASAQ